MNNRRRRNIGRAIEDYLSAETEAREKLRSALEEAMEEEEEAYDNLPEALQDGDKGESMQDAIGAIDELLSELDDDPYYDPISTLREILGIDG